MPKKLKRVVYYGPAKEFRKEFRDGRVVVIPKNTAVPVDDDIFEILMNGKKTNHLAPVLDIQDKYHKKLTDRLIRE